MGDPESLVAGTGVTLEYAWVGLAGAAGLCREKGLRLWGQSVEGSRREPGAGHPSVALRPEEGVAEEAGQ